LRLFFGGGKALSFSFLFVKYFLEVTLRLQIKLLYPLRVVNLLRIYFLISNNDSLPDGFVGLLESDCDVFLVFDAPETVVDFYFFLEVTVNKWLLGAFNLDKEMLGLDFDV
jgi:hypothetical protein